MKNNKTIVEGSQVKLSKIILLGSGLITLYFDPNIQDPFSAPKQWLLLLLSAWILGQFITKKGKQSLVKNEIVFTVLLILFVSFQLLSFLHSRLKYNSAFGENLRKDGVVTYLSFTLIMFIISTCYRALQKEYIFYLALVVGSALSFYGLLQLNGIDFVKWNNPYNSIIGTVGNPNFASAIMAILGILIFSIIFNKNFNIVTRLYAAIVSNLLIALIYKSASRQGLIVYLLGVTIILIVIIHTKKKNLGWILFMITNIIGITAIFGMFQRGPLTSLLYKDSVSVRGYYWRAGLEMLNNNFAFGVGPDLYGYYFKEYREVFYPLKYGFDLTSTNAHNVFIQIFATTGIFSGICYLFLSLFIFWRAIYGIKKSNNGDRYVLVSIFAAWIGYIAQSVISIDNIGISIWGWVLGGIIIALTGKQKENLQVNSSKNKFLEANASIVSSLLLLVTFILVIFLHKGEVNMYKTRQYYNPEVVANKSTLNDFANKTINTPLVDPTYKIISASYLVNTGFVSEGLSILEKLHNDMPRNLDVLNLLAVYNNQLGNYTKAITFREKIAKLDPWNTENYLKLGRYYKSIGEINSTVKILSKINSFDKSSNSAVTANKELKLIPNG
jgi:O-antigen ligase